MKKILKITLIIVFILGLFYYGSNILSYLFLNAESSAQEKVMPVLLDNKFKLEDVKDINICQLAGNVKFINYNDDIDKYINGKLYDARESVGDNNLSKSKDNVIEVYVCGNDSTKASIDFNDGILNITNNQSGGMKNGILLYVPSQYSGRIIIENAAGNCSVTNFKNATLFVSLGCGNIDLKSVKDIDIRLAAGNININEITNLCEIECGASNIKIDKISIKENSKISVRAGNIRINNKQDDIYVDANLADNSKSDVPQEYNGTILEIDNLSGEILVGHTIY